MDVFQREVREAFRQVALDTADVVTNITNITGGIGAVNSVTSLSPELTAAPTSGDVELTLDLSGYSPTGHTHPESDITGIITDVVAGTNLSGGGASGVVTLNVVPNPSFAGNVTLGDTSADSHTANGVLNVQQLRGKIQNYTGSGVVTIALDPDATILRLDCATNPFIIGLSGGFDGRIILIENVGAAHAFLYEQNGGAAAADRFIAELDGGFGLLQPVKGKAMAVYDGTASRWRLAFLLGISTPASLSVLGYCAVAGNLTVADNATLGNATTDAHTLNGTLNANSTAGSNGQVLQISGGLPVWGSAASAGVPTGTGTANTLTKWTGASTIGDSSVTDNGAGTVAVSQGYLQLQKPNGQAPELDFIQTGHPTWALYGHGGADTFALWNSAVGDIFFFGGTGAAQLNTSLTVINDLTVNGNTTLGNAGGDTLDVNCDLSKFGTTGGDGAVYIRNQGVHGAYSTNATAALYVNESGYLGGVTQFRDLFVMDGKGALIIDVDGASKQVDFYGNVLARDDLRVLGDLVVDGDMVINDAVNGIITARVLIADTINTPAGSGGNIEADGAMIAKFGFQTGDPTGSPTPGYIRIGTQKITATGTYTPTANVRAVKVRMIGGGGGGGGAQGGNACGGGGASGAYWEKWIDPGATITGGAATIGAAGTGGSTAGGNGGTGGDTSLVVQGITYTAKGGLGGVGMLTPAGTFAALGGGKQAGTSAGDVTFQEPGYPSLFINASFYYAGKGGSSPLGAGGAPTVQTASAAGTVGTGFGAGGSGGQGAAQAGAVGTAGVILVEEYG